MVRRPLWHILFSGVTLIALALLYRRRHCLRQCTPAPDPPLPPPAPRTSKRRWAAFTLAALLLVPAGLLTVRMLQNRGLIRPIYEPDISWDVGPSTLNRVPFVPQIAVSLQPPHWPENDLYSTIALQDVGYKWNASWMGVSIPAGRVCIDRVSVFDLSFYDADNDLTGANLLSGMRPLCASIEKNTTPNLTVQHYLLDHRQTPLSPGAHQFEFSLSRPHSTFPYPYDGVSSDLGVQVSYRLLEGPRVISSTVSMPEVFVTGSDAATSNWHVDITAGPRPITLHPFENGQSFFGGVTGGMAERVTFALSRPWIYQIADPFITLAVFALVVMLLWHAKVENFIETAGVLLFGIFSLKGLLVSPAIQAQTIWDWAIAALYLLLAVSIFFYLSRRYVTRR